MKKTLLLVLLCVSTFVQAQFLTYTDIAPMPEPRTAADATAYNGKIYIASGNSNTGYYENILVYDIATNSYTTIPEITPTRYGNIEVSGGKLYIFNGQRDNGIMNTWITVYDLATSSLSYVANPYPSRNAGSVVNSNGDIYFFGGANEDEGVFYNRLVKYVPSTGQFTLMANMPNAMETKGEIVNGELFVFGGFNGSSLNSVYQYNITSNVWNATNFSVPNGISANTVTTDGSRIFLTGDFSNQTNNKIYEVENALAYQIFDVSQSGMVGRRHHSSVIVNDKLYIFGGNTATSLTSTLTSAQVANLPMNIGMIGAFVSWSYDVVLTTNDGVNYFYGAGTTPFQYAFPSTGFKFRKHNTWTINWGSNTFPTGIGTQDGADIFVPQGNYYVYFNRITGAYQFSTTLANPEQMDQENELTFYPNPASDFIRFNKDVESVTVYDLLGKERKVSLTNNEVALSELATGTYLMKVVTQEGISFTKTIIKK